MFDPAQGDSTMPQGYLEELITMATDPSFDSPQPGVEQRDLAGQPMLRPSFAAGGAIPGPQQAGLAPQGAQQQVPPQMLEQELQRMMKEHPQEIAKITQVIQAGLQSGELTPQELNMAVQLATAAAQNPQLWPQLRQFAIQQGLAGEQDLPQEYDQGLVFVLLLAAKASQGAPQGAPQGGIPQSQGQPPQATMATGGPMPESRNADGSIAINAHKGEYMIPEHVVRAKGTDFFDKMIGKDDKASA